MLDMMKMMGKLKEVQARMKETQEALERLHITGESGAGLVKATVTGKRRIIAVTIDPSLLRADQQDIVQDLVVAAINKANEEAEKQATEQLKKSSEGLLPNIPGMDLSSLMG